MNSRAWHASYGRLADRRAVAPPDDEQHGKPRLRQVGHHRLVVRHPAGEGGGHGPARTLGAKMTRWRISTVCSYAGRQWTTYARQNARQNARTSVQVRAGCRRAKRTASMPPWSARRHRPVRRRGDRGASPCSTRAGRRCTTPGPVSRTTRSRSGRVRRCGARRRRTPARSARTPRRRSSCPCGSRTVRPDGFPRVARPTYAMFAVSPSITSRRKRTGKGEGKPSMAMPSGCS